MASTAYEMLVAPAAAHVAPPRYELETPPPPPYVGAIDLDVFNNGRREALPGLPEGGHAHDARSKLAWLFNSQTPRPQGHWALHMLDRSAALRQTPAYLLGQVALLVWDAVSSDGNQRTAAAVVAAFTQLAPAVLLWCAASRGRNARPNLGQRIIAGAADSLSLAIYPVGMPLALLSLAALEVSESKMTQFIRFQLGRPESSLAAKNIMQVVAALGCLAIGREIERVTGLQTWFEQLAAYYLATPGNGCQTWLASQAGVDLFVNCVDTSGPTTFALTCSAATASCVGATFGSLNRTRLLPPQQQALNMSFSDTLQTAVERNVANLSTTAAWVRNIAEYQFSNYVEDSFGYSVTNLWAQQFVEDLVTTPYLANVAKDESISDADLAATLAAATLRIDASVPDAGFDPGSAYDRLKSMFVALGARGSVVEALTRSAGKQPLTNTVFINSAQEAMAVNASGTGTIDLALVDGQSWTGLSSQCQPTVGNLAIQWAGGSVNGVHPSDLPAIANLSAFGGDPSVFFASCDAHSPDAFAEPMRSVAQAVTNAWAAPDLGVIGETNCTAYCRGFTQPDYPAGPNGCGAYDYPETLCDPVYAVVPSNWNAWRANLTTALQARNATAQEAQAIASSWDALHTYVANIFGNKTLG